MKFASACYGWKFIYGLAMKQPKKFLSSLVGAANISALCDHTGIAEQDVVCGRWTSSMYDGGHFVAIAHAREKIVVAFRGTYHIRDALLDLVATNTQFLNGLAHTGILKASFGKLQILSPVILDCCKKYPSYKVIVVGHSLGAGIASLFTLLFNTAYPEIPIHCYAFAPPCVMSIEMAMAPQTLSLVDSVVNNVDIIPRLSYVAAAQLKEVMSGILSQGNNTFQRLLHLASSGNAPKFTKTIASLLKVPPFQGAQRKVPATVSEVSMFPPGRVFHIFPHQKLDAEPIDETTAASKETNDEPDDGLCVMEESSASLFIEIIVSESMFGDHMPNQYEEGLARCLKMVKNMTHIEIK